MVWVQITTDCSVFDRFYFQCIVCLFLVSMAYIAQYKWWKWYATVGIVWEQLWILSLTVPKLKWFALYHTNLSHEVLLSFVLWSFQVLGDVSMDYGIRIGKILSLGMPKAPQGNIQGRYKQLSLGMPGRHPLFRLQHYR